VPINKLEDDFRVWEPDRAELESGLPSGDRRRWLASRNIDEVKRLALLREIVAHKQYGYVDGLLVDVITAGWLMALYDELNEKNKATFISQDLAVMCHWMYKLKDKGSIHLSIVGG